MVVLGPTIVPISAHGGDFGAAGAAGAASAGGGAATIGGGKFGGRRDAENSGRSRVAAKALNGTAQSGFPLFAGSSGLDTTPARVCSVTSATAPSLGTGA